jgi:F-type H+-transporting ATPase subunit gamma
VAKARALVKRRKAVGNIRKICRTMQLIATARFQQAMNRAMAGRPYTNKIVQLIGHLAEHAGQIEHPLLKVNAGADRQAMLVITSNRGLCGSYNANVLRTAVTHLRQADEKNVTVDLHVIGRKAINYFRFLRREITSRRTDIEDKPRFDQVASIADRLMEQYVAAEIDSAHVAFMQFLSVGMQRPMVLTLLPVQAVAGAEHEPHRGRNVEYDFSPAPQTLLARLLPEAVRVRLYQCFTDAAVSEQVARMTAMKAATDAATDMIKLLTRRYNRARQTQITLELLDIMGGAEALKAS